MIIFVISTVVFSISAIIEKLSFNLMGNILLRRENERPYAYVLRPFRYKRIIRLFLVKVEYSTDEELVKKYSRIYRIHKGSRYVAFVCIVISIAGLIIYM